MQWTELKSEKTFRNKILSEVDWEHSFIREISVVSPSYILPDYSVVAPDCLPCIRVFICSQSDNIQGLELMFVEAEEFSVGFSCDLNPNVYLSDGVVKWTFSDVVKTTITSKTLYYRVLSNDAWGKELRYGWEDVFDGGGTLAIV